MVPAGATYPQQIRSDVRIGVATLYDDNLLRTNRQRGGLEDAEDWRVTPTLSVDLHHDLGRHAVFLKGDAGYDFYHRNEQLNAERIALEGGGKFIIDGRCRADLLAAVDFRQSDIAELGVVISNRSRNRTFSGRFSCPRPAGFFPEVNVSRAVTDNSSRARSIFDLRVLNAGGALVYARPTLGRVALYYNYGELDRPGVIDPVTGRQDATRIHRAGMRYDRNVAARLGAAFALGGIDANPRGAGKQGFSGIDWLGEVEWRPSPATGIRARFQRELRGESNFGASFIVADSVGLESRWRLSAKTALELRARRERRKVRGEEATPGFPLRQSDKTATLGATLRYDLAPSLLLAGEVGYSRRDARNSFYDYRSTRAGLRADYRF